jgi:hypothetical protein
MTALVQALSRGMKAGVCITYSGTLTLWTTLSCGTEANVGHTNSDTPRAWTHTDAGLAQFHLAYSACTAVSAQTAENTRE